MEDSLDAVSRHCSEQLMNYQRCLLLNNNDAASQACDAPKRALTACASTAAPALARLRHLCAPKIRAYDACLAAYKHLPDDEFTQRCGPRLLELHRCTLMVQSQVEHGGEAERRRGEDAFTAQGQGQHGPSSSAQS